MRTSTKFLVAFVLSAGVLLLSATAGLLLAVAADLGWQAGYPVTWGALRNGFRFLGISGVFGCLVSGWLGVCATWDEAKEATK